MAFSAEKWHRRFQMQALWTSRARAYLLSKAHLGWRGRLLEVGCGTGAVTAMLQRETRQRVYGVDINREFLQLAAGQDRKTRFSAGDGLALPFASGAFTAAVCHFLLLWIAKPEQVLAEMVRVTRPGGWVMAFAEPDYGGRIDAPQALESLGRLQADALRNQGAASNRGRELAQLFQSVGLACVESGVLGEQWHKRGSPAEIAAEWEVLEQDLQGTLPAEELHRLERVNREAWERGSRVLFVPTFYAIGKKQEA